MTADQLLDDLVLYVRPPRAVAIRLTERPGDPNWVASAGVMTLVQVERFHTKVAALRKQNAVVDWSGVSERFGQQRTLARWLTDVLRREGAQ